MTTKKSESNRAFSALNVEVPKRAELASIEPALESLNDLAERRDQLRFMAERAEAEAQRLNDELRKTFDSHKRQLASLAAGIGVGGGK